MPGRACELRRPLGAVVQTGRSIQQNWTVLYSFITGGREAKNTVGIWPRRLAILVETKLSLGILHVALTMCPWLIPSQRSMIIRHTQMKLRVVNNSDIRSPESFMKSPCRRRKGTKTFASFLVGFNRQRDTVQSHLRWESQLKNCPDQIGL